ncbi:MAG: sugar ABC transporter ATP-binding protein [Gemmatimonadota bacterium]
MTGIRKAFPGTLALDDVSFDVHAGETHVLLGENGAGKSTLMKTLSGALARDAGTIAIHGIEVRLSTPHEARAMGVGIIYQELSLVPGLSVAENIFLGRAPGRFGWVDHARMIRDAGVVLRQLGVELDPRRLVLTLSLAEQQVVEIARALSLDARVLVMDEPTSALTEREAALLFGVIRGLTARGVAVVYISHRLDEIFAIGDRVTVLRDGRNVATRDVRDVDRRELIRLMADRDVDEQFPATPRTPGAERLRVEGLTRGRALQDVSFTVRAGEIVALSGLLGAGRTETARAIFGLDPIDRGHIFVDGREVRMRGPRDAIAAGIGFVTEDRKGQGLLLDQSVEDNIALPVLHSLGRWGIVRRARVRTVALDAVRDLRIRTPSTQQHVRLLSGGNQQKVVLAKWLATGAGILFLDEPTRGIDVGAKQEIYLLINRLAASGAAVVLISSDLPEIIGLADRTLVMRDGRIAGAFPRAECTPERLMACAVSG